MEEVHEEARSAAEVEHRARLEDLLDQLRMACLDAPARVEVVAVAALAPVRCEVTTLVMVRFDRLLVEHHLLECPDLVLELMLGAGGCHPRIRGARHFLKTSPKSGDPRAQAPSGAGGRARSLAATPPATDAPSASGVSARRSARSRSPRRSGAVETPASSSTASAAIGAAGRSSPCGRTNEATNRRV